jgi:hypothetical protein
VQERMTQQIAEFLQDTLQPQGVAVVVEGLHMCAAMRGEEWPTLGWSPLPCWGPSRPIRPRVASSSPTSSVHTLNRACTGRCAPDR